MEIEKGMFNPSTTLNHTHAGSIGNLCNDRIEMLKSKIIADFNFDQITKAEEDLLRC